MTNRGKWYAIAAYGLWGLFPLYWKQLASVPVAQLLGHRVVWSFLVLLIIIRLRKHGSLLREALRSRREWFTSALAAVLLGGNWLLFLWAVTSDFVLEASLGYFINPLLNVVLGVVFFRERLRVAQWLAVGLAAIGVLYLTFVYGSLPWIALALAFSFGTYGLIKKTARLGPIDSLTFEMGLLLLPALLYLIWTDVTGEAAFLHSGFKADCLIMCAGIVTATPLLLFGAAARRIPLSLIGMIQYIAPTMHLLLGVFLYHEPFTRSRMIGFCFIWMALAVFACEGLYSLKKSNAVPNPMGGTGIS